MRATGGAADAPAYRVERGFVTGIIDLVFEHEGRVYFLDWKSDRLPDYGPDVLARHVQQHYALQARLYTLAVTRLFGLCEEASYDERFGGLAYLFLRAAPAEGDPAAPAPGLHFERPSFADLGAWESELLGEGAQLPGLDAPAASPRRPS